MDVSTIRALGLTPGERAVARATHLQGDATMRMAFNLEVRYNLSLYAYE